MAVHAHPDDEVIPTGGVLARYAAEGVTTVVVTCTDGRQGFAPGFANPGEPGHEPAAVAAVRARELEASCALLGVRHLERLGYGDSGMRGWEGNGDPTSFCNAALDEAATKVAALLAHYRPQVVVTYDERAGEGHPDHVMAHRVALAASAESGIPDKLYLSVRSAAFVEEMAAARDALGLSSPRPSGRAGRRGTPDELVTTRVDTGAYALVKQRALAAHASQLDGSPWLAFPEEVLEHLFASETFIRLDDRTGAPLPEDDLFAGLR
ncbi:MAG TPA: PIG-L family deacetylase [Acidimicrobiales bacterium]|nr:PIG-L family deacetylase [Acidimicrobiales bacterium]